MPQFVDTSPNTLEPSTEPAVLTLPPLTVASHSTAARMDEHWLVRHQAKPIFACFSQTRSSRDHSLQDAITLLSLHGGGLLAGISDGTTNSRKVHTEDATFLVNKALVEQVRALAETGDAAWPAKLLRQMHVELRKWLDATPGAACGVAQSLVLIAPFGHVSVATVGDPQVLLFKPGRKWLRRPRLIPLTAAPIQSEGANRLVSALGQSNRRPLRFDVSHARMERGDLLLLGSDGGLPAPEAADLLAGLVGYRKEVKAGLRDLARLGSALDARAQLHLPYDDDRSLLIVERL